MAQVDHIACGIYRISSFAPTSDISFNQFLIESAKILASSSHGFIILLSASVDLLTGEFQEQNNPL
jgi:hypothetical protein